MQFKIFLASNILPCLRKLVLSGWRASSKRFKNGLQQLVGDSPSICWPVQHLAMSRGLPDCKQGSQHERLDNRLLKDITMLSNCGAPGPCYRRITPVLKHRGNPLLPSVDV